MNKSSFAGCQVNLPKLPNLSPKVLLLVLLTLIFDLALLLLAGLLVFGLDQPWLQPIAADALKIAKLMVTVGILGNVMFLSPLIFHLKGPFKSLIQSGAANVVEPLQGKAYQKPPKAGSEITGLDGDIRSMANSLKQAGEKERAILSYASDVICSFDLAGRCISMNPACKRLWGYEPDELVGGDIFAIIAGPDRQQLVGHVQSVHVKKGPGEYELKVCRQDGTMADTLWSLYWSVENGWIVGVVHDITSRKLAERQQTEFAAMVWHDLRSPLATIQMFLQSLEAEVWGVTAPAVRSNAGKARGLVDRLIRLTDDLLAYQRIEAGELELNLEELELSDVIDQSLHSVSGLAQQIGVKIESPQCTQKLIGDRTRLVQVLTNLLSNAVKFSPPKQTVTVSVSEDATFLVLSTLR